MSQNLLTHREVVEDEIRKAEEEVHLLQSALGRLTRDERLEAFSRLSQLEILVEQLLGDMDSSYAAAPFGARSGGSSKERASGNLLAVDDSAEDRSVGSGYRDADADEAVIDSIIGRSQSREGMNSREKSPLLPDTPGYRKMLSGGSSSSPLRVKLTLEPVGEDSSKSRSSPERSGSPTSAPQKVPLYRMSSGASSGRGSSPTGPPPQQLDDSHRNLHSTASWSGGGSSGLNPSSTRRGVPNLALDSAQHTKSSKGTRVVMVNPANFKPVAQSLQVSQSQPTFSSSPSGGTSPPRRSGRSAGVPNYKGSGSLNLGLSQSASTPNRKITTGAGGGGASASGGNLNASSGSLKLQQQPPESPLQGMSRQNSSPPKPSHNNHVAIAQLLEGMKSNRN